MKGHLKILLVILSVGVVGLTVAGLFVAFHDPIAYWHSIKSFSAEETIKIGNQTFESYVNFTKPGEIIRVDYLNGSLVQKVVIENGVEKIVTSNETFTLNATLEDVNALDPFASILNNLDSFNVTINGHTLILKPKKTELPVYEVQLSGKLPERITITQNGMEIVVEYCSITVKT